MHRDTRIQHQFDDRERHGGGAAPPIYRTSLFTFADCEAFARAYRGEGERPTYTRVGNPTTRILEQKIADLEGAEECIALASGMAAVSATLFGLLSQGDHVVMLASAYGPTLALARGMLHRFGVEVSFVAAADFDGLEARLRPRTRLLYLESPASLTFDILDLEAIARTARARGLITVLDNSWATPLFQQPLCWGIDLALHSGTKYISGHSDVLLGLVAGPGALIGRLRDAAIALGGALSPEDAFLAIRGLRTLPIRMARHQESALAIARRLAADPRVRRVLHPGLPSFPRHELAARQLSGYSGLFSFEIAGDPRRFADALEVFRIGVSWGGFESLALPLRMTLPADPAANPRPDVADGLVRLSIGLEDAQDLIDDLERGFRAL
jgi:cystathionine beta-lyase